MRLAQFVILIAFAASAIAGPLDDIGLTDLRQRSGALLGRGFGVGVAQVEAAEFGAYAPNVANGDFVGKKFTFMGISRQPVSGHATNVATTLYGNSAGIAPRVRKVLLFSNEAFIFSGGLHFGETAPPAKLRVPVINNAWVGNMQTDAASNEVLRRLDYMIVRDDVFVANGLDNANLSPVHVLMAAAYNGLNVGITPGLGNTFTAQTRSSFRLTPDLIVPVSTTSQATAHVAGSAALLVSEARAHKKPVSSLGVRASLLAGAERLDGWRATRSSPLDPVQGAGQLRVDRSFDILMGGERTPGSRARTYGWDAAVVQPKRKLIYNIILPRPATHFSAALIWNRRISDANVSFLKRSVTLANLDLQLLRKKGKAWVQAGRSFHTGDNLEYIAKDALIAGTYRLAVTGSQEEAFALAWYTDFPLMTDNLALTQDLASRLSPAFGAPPGSSIVVPEPVNLLLWPLSLMLLRRHRRALRHVRHLRHGAK